jgi:asparagine synthase (glutamine-hydrolysing)
MTDYREVYAETLWYRGKSHAQNSVDRLVDNYINLYLHDDILVKVDRASMIHSLEVRAPFLDTALAEFVCRLPSPMKVRGKTRKYLLKKALEKKLPREILCRPKKGFGMPYAKWCQGPLKEMLLDTLSEDSLDRRKLFDVQWVKRLIKGFLENRTNTAKEIWTLFVFELWRQQHRL